MARITSGPRGGRSAHDGAASLRGLAPRVALATAAALVPAWAALVWLAAALGFETGTAGSPVVLVLVPLGMLIVARVVRWMVVVPLDALGEATRAVRHGAPFGSALTGRPDEIGAVARQIAGMTEDLTARRGALRLEQEKLQATMAHSVDGLIVIDDAGMIHEFSPPAERIFGYAREAVVGRNIDLLMPESHCAEHHADIARYVATGDARAIGRGRELHGRRKDGTVFPMDLAIGEMPSGDARRLFVGTVRDISERVATEARLRQAQKMEVTGQLTGGVAHDFNNLLSVIMGNLEIMADEAAAGGSVDLKLLSSAVTACRRGATLTHRLLAFSRQMPHQRAFVELGEIVEESIRMLDRTLGERIRIRSEQDAELLWVHLDRSELGHAIVNIAVNARDAMPDGGTLVFRSRRIAADEAPSPELRAAGGELACLSIEDTGRGMAPEILAKVFEPFFTTKPVGEGSGLGLSMVYGFVKQSGGWITVESTPGAGTVVTLYFALRPPPDHQSRSADDPVRRPRAGTRILLVEDDAPVRFSIARQMTRLGCVVQAVPSAAEALAVLRSSRPVDMIVSDAILAGPVDGISLITQAQAVRPGLRALCISGYLDIRIPEDLPLTLLMKPFTQQELAEALLDALAADGHRAAWPVA